MAQRIEYQVAGDPSQFLSAMGRVEAAGRDAFQKVAGSASPLTGILDKVNGALFAMTAVLAGGALFGDAVEETVKMGVEAEKLARVLGTTSAEASVLNIALGDVYSDADTYTAAVGKLTRELKSNEAGLNALGIKTRDVNGNLRDTQAVFFDAAATVNSFREGTDRNLISQQLFGKSALELNNTLRLTPQVLDAARQKAADLGLEIGPEAAARIAQYRAAMNDVGDVMAGIKNAIGQALLPVLSDLANWFASGGTGAVSVFRTAIDAAAAVIGVLVDIVQEAWSLITDAFAAIGDVVTSVFGGEVKTGLELFGNVLKIVQAVALGFKTGIVLAFEVVRGVVLVLAERLKTFGEIARAVFALDFTGAQAAYAQGARNVEAVIADSQQRILDKTAKNAQAIQDTLLGTKPGTAVQDDALGGTRTAPEGLGSSKGSAKPKTRVAEFDEDLNALKTAFALQQEAQGSFQAYSQQSEADYWQALLTRQDLTAAERAAIERKYVAAAGAIRREAAAQEFADFKARQQEFRNDLDARLGLAQRAQTRALELYGQDSREYRQAAAEVVSIERDKQQQLQSLQAAQAEADQKLALDRVAFEESLSQLELQAGDITQGEQLARQVQFENQRFEIQRSALQRRLELLQIGSDADVAAVQKAQIDIEALEQSHQQRLVILGRQSALEQQGLFGSTLQSLESTWAGGLQRIAQGTLTLGSALRGVWSSISGAFTGMVSQLVVKWLLGESAKTGATLFHTTLRGGIELAAAIKSAAVSTGFALKDIAIKAYQAAAGAYAAIAAIPYVGPFLAPVVAAGTLAAVIGFGANIASAEGGYDIPAGVNPITQLHEKEMVLPRAQADAVRGLADGGPGGSEMTLNVVQKMKGGYLVVHETEVVKVLKQARRNFVPVNN